MILPPPTLGQSNCVTCWAVLALRRLQLLQQFVDQVMCKYQFSTPIIQSQVYFYQIAGLTLYIRDVAIVQNIVDHIVRFNMAHCNDIILLYVVPKSFSNKG